MSDLTNVFTDIADAIRAKTETQITYKPTEMANAINNIETGGGALVYDANGVDFANWFNSPITIAEWVTNTANMFLNLYNFNQPVTIPNGVTNTANMFCNCYNFNQPIIIPDNVTHVYQMFCNCHSFNQPIIIPDGVADTGSLFQGCYNFNQPIIIPDNVTHVYQMFRSCNNFNQPVIIPDGVTNAYRLFMNCHSFNQPIIIPDGVADISLMFQDCHSFNQPIIIPNNVFPAVQMFQNCYSFGSNIYMYANQAKATFRSILANCNNSLSKHIFTNNTNTFNGTASSNSITGKAMTWTQDGGDFYNTTYNIYIHNVAEPYIVLNNAEYHFNQSSPLPDSPAIVFGSGVRDLNFAFYFWVDTPLNNNTLILFEEGVENLKGCFTEQWLFNQPLTIPSSARDCSEMFVTCENLNSDIVFRNGVENIKFTLSNCQNFGANLWIPESVTDISRLLNNTPYASGTVHISHNIALGDTTNYIYNSLVNGYIGITLDPSRILNDY